jgi:hypothetical protein
MGRTPSNPAAYLVVQDNNLYGPYITPESAVADAEALRSSASTTTVQVFSTARVLKRYADNITQIQLAHAKDSGAALTDEYAATARKAYARVIREQKAARESTDDGGDAGTASSSTCGGAESDGGDGKAAAKAAKGKGKAEDGDADAAEPKAKRAPSAYNIFMKDGIARLKDDPAYADKKHKELFKIVADQWRFSDDNPKKAQNEFVAAFVTKANVAADDADALKKTEAEALDAWKASQDGNIDA